MGLWSAISFSKLVFCQHGVPYEMPKEEDNKQIFSASKDKNTIRQTQFCLAP